MSTRSLTRLPSAPPRVSTAAFCSRACCCLKEGRGWGRGLWRTALKGGAAALFVPPGEARASRDTGISQESAPANTQWSAAADHELKQPGVSGGRLPSPEAQRPGALR